MGDYNASSFYRFAKRGHRFKCWECGVKKKAPCGEVDRADLPWCCHRRLGAYLPLLSSSTAAATPPNTISIQSALQPWLMPPGCHNGTWRSGQDFTSTTQVGAAFRNMLHCRSNRPKRNRSQQRLDGVCLGFMHRYWAVVAKERPVLGSQGLPHHRCSCCMRGRGVLHVFSGT